MNEASPILSAEARPEGDADPEGLPEPPRMHGDLTQGPILRTLMLFSIPMLISNVLQTLNGSVNAVWVGRLIGESALAATANANVIMFLLFGAVFGFGMATTVRVGQHFGARDFDAARRSFGSGAGFCVLMSCVTGITGWFASDALLHMMGTPEASRLEALAYLRVIFITMPLGTASLMVSMGMRGAGDSKTPLYAMILTVVADIALNPLLIVGLGPVPALGIAGSAIATAIANFMGFAFQVWHIYRRDLPLRLRGPELGYLVPRSDELSFIVFKGLPMGAQMILISSASLIMLGLVNRLGLDTTAAYGASLQLWNYLQMPALAISGAVSAMAAQSVGAGDHARIDKVAKVGLSLNIAMMMVMAVVILAFAGPLTALFVGSQSPAVPIAEHIQAICIFSFVVVSITVVLHGVQRAYGVVVTPLVIMFLGLYPGRIGFFFLAEPYLGGDATWWAFPVGSFVTVALTVLQYRFGKWRHAALQRKS